ncbi:MAG: 3'(2'),5'-bisphosphate nucleotidase CysQ [Bacteroidota bacterium]
MDYHILIEPLLEIARSAGAAIMDIYHNASDIEIQSKDDNSPLTKADKAANAIICEGLEKLPLQFPIISEENKAVPYETRKDYKQFWLVDPLDGTKEFIKRNGEFTVNIALVEDGRPVLGVVYAPDPKKMYYALKGHGAHYLHESEEKQLQANAFTLADSDLGVVCSRSHLNEETQAFIDRLDNPEKVSKGSSLKFLILAEGGAHVYPRLAPTMEWDTGAAQIILEEAGGKVLRADDKNPLVYNKENLLNPYFIAYGNTSDQ